MDEDTIAMLNAPNNALIGQFLHEHPMGAIIWEQTRYEQDVYYCENNIITTNIVGCANNTRNCDQLPGSSQGAPR